jgi:hypothetical protein
MKIMYKQSNVLNVRPSLHFFQQNYIYVLKKPEPF